MAQLIYAISALGIVAVFSFMMQRSSLDSDQSIYTNEIRSQLMSIARDVADDLNRRDLPFDEATDENRGVQPVTYPRVHSPIELTSPAQFGSADCKTDASKCLDLDDFDGHELSGNRNGLDFTGKVSVRYVDETTLKPDTSQTFAKEVTVEVETPALMIGDDPAAITFNMVVAYPRFTDYSVGTSSGTGGTGGGAGDGGGSDTGGTDTGGNGKGGGKGGGNGNGKGN